MKIIAKTTEDKLLIEITEIEFYNVIGYKSINSNNVPSIEKLIKSGDKVDVSDIYKKHNLILDIQRLPNYLTARTNLKNILDALTPIEELINKLIPKKEE